MEQRGRCSKSVFVMIAFFAVAAFTGCAYVFKGYQIYPVGVSYRTQSQKSIFIQPVIDKRVNNVKAMMFYGPEKPTKYLVRFREQAYFVEDPAV